MSDRVNSEGISKAIEKLQAAQAYGMAVRPKVGGFPYLAEAMRQAGVKRNHWFLPAFQSLYLTDDGPVVTQGEPLLMGTVDVPPFDRDAVIKALRTDQAGESTFPEFMTAIWNAGVIRYEVDLIERTVTYYGSSDEKYVEAYPAVAMQRG